MANPLYLSDIQPFLDFVNGNIGTKLFSSDAFATWTTPGKPIVNTGAGYGATLGSFPVLWVDGTWDMTANVNRNYILQYPVLDGVAESYGALPWPGSSPSDDTHWLEVQEGDSPGFYLAATDNGFKLISGTGATGDLPVPISAGLTSILLETSLGLTAPPGSGEVVAFSGVLGSNPSQTKTVFLALQVTVTGMGPSLQFIGQYVHPGGTDFLSTTVPMSVVPDLPSVSRLVIYVDGTTRQVGVFLDGVDYGWLLLPSTDPFVLPSDITSLAIVLEGLYTGIPAADPQIGNQVSIHHSIDTSLITETLPGTLGSWYTQTTTDPTPPVDYTVGSRYYAAPGGSYGGVGAETGDLVEFVDTGAIYVYPRADTVVRLSRYTTDINALQTDLTAFEGTTTAHLTTLDGQVTALQTDNTSLSGRVTVLENRFGPADLLQSAILNAQRSGAPYGCLTGQIVADPGGPAANLTVCIVATGATGDFAGFPAGSLAIYDTLNTQWVNVNDIPEGLKIGIAGGVLSSIGCSIAYGNCLEYALGRLASNTLHYAGSEPVDGSNLPVAPNWVSASVLPRTGGNGKPWILTGTDEGIPVIPRQEKTNVLTLDSGFTRANVTLTLSHEDVVNAEGSVLVRNHSAGDVLMYMALYATGSLAIVNRDTGDSISADYLSETGLSLAAGVVGASDSAMVHWFADRQPDRLTIYVSTELVRSGNSVATLNATVNAAVTSLPSATDLVTLSANTGVTSQTYVLPVAYEGRRLTIRPISTLTATLTATRPDVASVDASCSTLLLIPGSLLELAVKGGTWYLVSGQEPSVAPTSTDVILVGVTTSPGSLVLTVDGSGSVTTGNVPKTCDSPISRNVSLASHRISILACNPGRYYGLECLFRTKATAIGSVSYESLGQTLLSEDFDGVDPSEIGVIIDASNVDGLLRISANTTLGEQVTWKARVQSFFHNSTGLPQSLPTLWNVPDSTVNGSLDETNRLAIFTTGSELYQRAYTISKASGKYILSARVVETPAYDYTAFQLIWLNDAGQYAGTGIVRNATTGVLVPQSWLTLAGGNGGNVGVDAGSGGGTAISRIFVNVDTGAWGLVCGNGAVFNGPTTLTPGTPGKFYVQLYRYLGGGPGEGTVEVLSGAYNDYPSV